MSERVAIVSNADMLVRRSFHDFRKGSLRLSQRHAVLRPLRPGHGRLNGSEVQFQCVVEEWRRSCVRAEKHLLLAVGLDKSNMFLRPPGEMQIGQRLRVTGKKPIVAPYSGDMLAMVARSGTLKLDSPEP